MWCICSCSNSEEAPCELEGFGINEECEDIWAGNYHMVGLSYYWRVDTIDPPPVVIDDTVKITRMGDSIVGIYSYTMPFTDNPYWADTSTNYAFLWYQVSLSNHAKLVFRKSYNDSAYFYSQRGGLGSGTSIRLKGNKIH